MSLPFETSRIPFDDRKGLTVWPNGARMAVLVYTAAEQWIWDENEPIKPLGTFAAGRGNASTQSTWSAVAYGFNIGLQRCLEIYNDFDMSTTLMASGTAVEQFPDILSEYVKTGHELGAHGYSQGQVMALLSREAQEEAIQKSVELLESISGTRPTGWISPGAESNQDTVELLAANGFDHHGDIQDDELPYFLHVGDRTMVEIPYRLVGNLNDLGIFTRNSNSVTDGLRLLTDSFDASYRSAAKRPLVFNYGTHSYISGRPDNAEVLQRFLEHVHGHDDVWVTNYSSIAQWWREQYEGKIAAGGVIDVTS